ncbi:MAG: transketolase [Candidatus Moranbacteria bacterium RIFOXYB1_FULL_43_19]|nr:MAG: transketolase [Candidatus Moranbacteria bacterium RIFOXYB1_FULL_43_19]OGI33500.1 MAG: transketolase [Candidatus Moranbacteria bacterium RIFOXYC1_FULL_44_13]OGI37923.1 MAG: transketolase [Candidatus Moranbacteria bacterium RIFOXYD1_FULL_44_12]
MNKRNHTKKLKKRIVKTAFQAGEGHIPSAFSILDILWVLYDKILKITPGKYGHPERNRFILSKGHASLGLYAVLGEKGFFSSQELEKFAQYGSFLGGHPDRNKVPGIEASTGSLGHGLPISVGIALGLKIKKIKRAKVYTIIGDGECNEGTIWESLLLASHHQLNNLHCIVDFNHSTDRALGLKNLKRKFLSFGWDTRVIDGHNHKQIFSALKRESKKPIAVIANTIKGAGSRLMENNPAWHHRSPTKEELKQILKELDQHEKTIYKNN